MAKEKERKHYTCLYIHLRDGLDMKYDESSDWWDWEVTNVGVIVKDKEGRCIAFVNLNDVIAVEME